MTCASHVDVYDMLMPARDVYHRIHSIPVPRQHGEVYVLYFERWSGKAERRWSLNFNDFSEILMFYDLYGFNFNGFTCLVAQ